MNNKNMKKLYIISIIAIVILIAAGLFLFQGNKSSDNKKQMPSDQNSTGLSIDSLAVGNWVSVVAEKGSDGTYIADMIRVCASKDSCYNNQQGGTGQTPPSGTGTAPSGEAPTGTPPSGGSSTGTKTAPSGTEQKKTMVNGSMLSGTITEVGTSAITLELDTGETATVTISDSTRIVER